MFYYRYDSSKKYLIKMTTRKIIHPNYLRVVCSLQSSTILSFFESRVDMIPQISNQSEHIPLLLANSFSASKETSRIVWKPKVFIIQITAALHWSPSSATCIQSKLCYSIHSLLILYSQLYLASQLVISFGFLYQNPVCNYFLPHTTRKHIQLPM